MHIAQWNTISKLQEAIICFVYQTVHNSKNYISWSIEGAIRGPRGPKKSNEKAMMGDNEPKIDNKLNKDTSHWGFLRL